MNHGIVFVVVLANALVLSLGGVITHLAFRAYRRTGANEYRAFTAGFGLVTLGLLVGGGAHQLLGADVLVGVVIQSVTTATGFGLLAYSVYAGGSSHTDGVLD